MKFLFGINNAIRFNKAFKINSSSRETDILFTTYDKMFALHLLLRFQSQHIGNLKK